MYINAISHYLPSTLIHNDYYTQLNGLTDEWIFQRSGIRRRTRAADDENTHTMAIEAIIPLLGKLPYDMADVDLIIGATYTPYDTVGTLAHAVQGHFNIHSAVAVTVSSACSSFINAIEIVEGYFAMGKSKRALVIASEHNYMYTNENCDPSAHLWGDGAGCVFISSEQCSADDIKILDVHTTGLGHMGKGVSGVYLRPSNGGLTMPYGRDIFVNACKFMAAEAKDIVEKNNYMLGDVNYLVPHQANSRIMDHVAKVLGIEQSRVISNIEDTGNTGCASTLICLSQNWQKFTKDDLILVTVFGGGYSSGAMLLKK
ncbi:MAG: Beta-ketoacyl-acyl-carrier-protein synthase [Deltaproteobacteria bacterium]|nr:Beta-ketoacyl-acyl-carrier-protein synthase [Deltaproteobacteria bacterium]